MLYLDNNAAKLLWTYVGMGRHDYPPNRNEMGGLMVGFRLSKTAAVVINMIPVTNPTVQSHTYLEWSGLEEIVMRRHFYEIQENLAHDNPDAAEKLAILGWFHTHPSNLPVFMSGTDRANQAEKYPDGFALVINPHTMVWKAYYGKNSLEIPVIMTVPKKEKRPSDYQKNKKRKNQYGLPRGGKKKRKRGR